MRQPLSFGTLPGVVMRSSFSMLLTFAISSIAQSELSAADNWPQWRGPNAQGVAVEGDYPVKFSADEGVTWKVKLPGPGSSSPTVWGDAIFVTCMINGEDGIVCYGLDGGERW